MNPFVPPKNGCRDGEDASMRVRLFEPQHCAPRCGCNLPPAAPPVTICNPWNPNEIAVVTLSLDECGNLVVCVRRENRCRWR